MIEWKYTEQYPNGTLHGSPSALATRVTRYQSLVNADDGPMLTQIQLIDLFAEPVYQLLRLSLLANAIERAGELATKAVRVVYVAPLANRALWASPASAAFATHASGFSGDLGLAWSALLRRPDRFVVIDSGRLVRPDMPTSDEFKARYGHLKAPPPMSDPAIADSP